MRTIFLNLYDYFSIYFASLEWERTFLFIKSFSLMLSFLLFAALVFLIIQSRVGIRNSLETVAKSVGAPKMPKRKMSREWSAVLKKIESGEESNLKLAVIEADKILDDILKRAGYKGDNMGERLKQITSTQIANIEAIWQAHKVRNNIVHDPDFRLTRADAENAVKIYQRALEDLMAL